MTSMLTQGPFALPMTDRQSFALEARLKELPRDFEPRRLALAGAQPRRELEGRSDVSWITTEMPDRQGDIVLASGMDDSHFKLNPIVTLNHDYTRPPAGRSLWRKLTQEKGLTGIKAKTYYPPRPKEWSEGPWLPDLAYGLLQAGLLSAKSIGFLPLKVHAPTQEEIRAQPRLAGVRAIVESWLLLEYACCFLPVQPYAVIEENIANAACNSKLARHVQLHAPQLQHASLNSQITNNNLRSLTRAQLLEFLGSPTFGQIFENSLQRTYQKCLGLV